MIVTIRLNYMTSNKNINNKNKNNHSKNNIPAHSVDTRELALEMLIEINERGAFSHIVLRSVLDKYQYLSKQDRAFMTRLVDGTIEYMLQLDYIIDSFSKTKVRKMKPFIRNLLRMSVYQIKYMDAVPDSAVCNEAVKLAKRHKFAQLSGFVNGVLRNIARNICKYRVEKLIETTDELVKIIEESIPKSKQKDGHPAKRTFQAIRIEVNNEIKPLYYTVLNSIECLKENGRLCIITFHSLEDRAVKNAYIEAQGHCTCPKELPYCVCNYKSYGKIINKKPIEATEQEKEENSRSKSAKLRIFERHEKK